MFSLHGTGWYVEGYSMLRNSFHTRALLTDNKNKGNGRVWNVRSPEWWGRGASSGDRAAWCGLFSHSTAWLCHSPGRTLQACDAPCLKWETHTTCLLGVGGGGWGWGQGQHYGSCLSAFPVKLHLQSNVLKTVYKLLDENQSHVLVNISANR